MSRTTLGLLAAVLFGPALTPAARAQQRMMVVESSEDGGPPQVMHFTGPDFGDLRRPDYVRRDLPIFRAKLELDEVQRLIVGVLLDTYLDAFKSLIEQRFPKLPFPMMLGAGGDAGAPGSPGGIVAEAIGADGEIGDLDVDVEAAGGGEVAIAIRTGAGGATVEAESDGGDDGVFVSVHAPEGMEIPEALREKLQAKARELAEKLRVRLAELEAEGAAPRPGGGGDAIEDRRAQLEDMQAALERFARQKETLRRNFLSEVQAQLTAEQLGNWPAFERAMTRIKTLPEGRLDGERTDLLEIVEALGLSSQAREAVAEALEDYEIALDEALVKRNDHLRESGSRLSEAIQDGRFDRAAAIADETTRLRVRVRDVNERHTETIAAKLPAEAAGEFSTAALKRSCPRVYRTTPALDTFAAAAGLQLDEDVAEAVASLETAYRTELGLLNEHLRKVIRREQPKQARRMVERIRAAMAGEGAGGMLGGDREDDPIRAALRKRSALGERYTKQVHALLTPEQVAEITTK